MVRACVPVRTCVCPCMHVRPCVHARACPCMHVCAHVCMCVLMCACACTRVLEASISGAFSVIRETPGDGRVGLQIHDQLLGGLGGSHRGGRPFIRPSWTNTVCSAAQTVGSSRHRVQPS